MQRGRTGDGYVYYRDRAGGADVTVYEHQLVALIEHDPRDVFDPDLQVHHVIPARDVNLQGWLELVDALLEPADRSNQRAWIRVPSWCRTSV